jgi:hypothetical protein
MNLPKQLHLLASLRTCWGWGGGLRKRAERVGTWGLGVVHAHIGMKGHIPATNGGSMHAHIFAAITVAALPPGVGAVTDAPPGRGPHGLAGRRRGKSRLCSTNIAQQGPTQTRERGLGCTNLTGHRRPSAPVWNGRQRRCRLWGWVRVRVLSE